MNILLTYILISFFQPLLPNSRLMTLCYAIHHVTAVTCLFIFQEIKEKKKRNQIKENRQK